MANSYFDMHGDLGQGPNTMGHADLLAWAQDEELPATTNFLETGETEDPAAVADEIDELETPNADIEEMRVALLDAAQRAQGILILSED